MSEAMTKAVARAMTRHGWIAYPYHNGIGWRIVACWPDGEGDGEAWALGIEVRWFTVHTLGEAMRAVRLHSRIWTQEGRA